MVVIVFKAKILIILFFIYVQNQKTKSLKTQKSSIFIGRKVPNYRHKVLNDNEVRKVHPLT